MADAATWPDEINKSQTKTADWHFVDVPVTAPFSIGTLCDGHNCVIDRIQEMSDRLRTNQTGFKPMWECKSTSIRPTMIRHSPGS